MKSGKPLRIVPIVLLILIIVNVVVFAELHPFKAGEPLFGLQNFIEQAQLKLKDDPLHRVDFSFELVERRLADLESVSQKDEIPPVVNALDQALITAILNIQYLDIDNAHVYYHNIQPLGWRVEKLITDLEMRYANTHLSYLKHKIYVLKNTSSPLELVRLVSENYLSQVFFIQNNPHPVLESEVVEHIIPSQKSKSGEPPKCMDCHQDGEYMDSAIECSKCHIPEVYFASKVGTDSYRPKYLEEEYPNHFSGDCIDCHRTKSWQIYQFDHRDVYTCICCHAGDYPGDDQLIVSSNQIIMTSLSKVNRSTMVSPHYPGDCAICHTDTTDWGVNGYDHQLDTCDGCHGPGNQSTVTGGTIVECTRETNCQKCHTYAGHTDGYGNFCAKCHQDVRTWRNVSIDHTGFSTCLGCHSQDIPSPSHFSSDCIQCHSISGWKDVSMNHNQQADCLSCHQAPSDHASQGFTAQCSTCHNTTSWSNAVFNHTLSNCGTCHTSPDNHYPDPCISCHFINSWTDISVNHTTLISCIDCHHAPVNHYIGLCSSCHNTTNWIEVTFNHTGYTYCSTCHTPPAEHYPGQCSDCHITTSWSDVSFNHSGFTFCSSCHTAPASHYPSECSLCHKTTTWSDVSFNHSGFTNCSSCHNPPPGHYSGECSLCHTTTSWSDVTFNHAGFTNCSSCHTRPPKHPGAQCSQCHTTDTWEIP